MVKLIFVLSYFLQMNCATKSYRAEKYNTIKCKFIIFGRIGGRVSEPKIETTRDLKKMSVYLKASHLEPGPCLTSTLHQTVGHSCGYIWVLRQTESTCGSVRLVDGRPGFDSLVE